MVYQSAEIHFYEQEKCAVFLQTNLTDNVSGAELQLAALFTIRMLSNFGICETSDQLAQLLLMAPEFISRFAEGELPTSLAFVDHQGHSGRYAFETSFAVDGETNIFNFKPKGFGWFGIGLGYYGPMAVQALLRKIAEKHKADTRFVQLLGEMAAACGRLHLDRRITVSNHKKMASVAIRTARSIQEKKEIYKPKRRSVLGPDSDLISFLLQSFLVFADVAEDTSNTGIFSEWADFSEPWGAKQKEYFAVAMMHHFKEKGQSNNLPSAIDGLAPFLETAKLPPLHQPLTPSVKEWFDNQFQW